MNKKICEGVKFKINEDKFLMAINKGAFLYNKKIVTKKDTSM